MIKCIICTEPLINPSQEHIIPDAFLYNPDNLIDTYDVCKECNTRFGHTIDDEFINHEMIKLLRFSYKDFMKKDKIPHRILKKDISKITVNNIKVSLDLEINKDGIFYKSKMYEDDNGKKFMFVRNNESEKNIKRYKKNNINLIVINHNKTPFNIIYENFSKGMNIPFSRFFYKVAIEYISDKFGQNIVLDNKFDDIRKLIIRETNTYNSWTNCKVIWMADGKEGVEYVTHKLGLSFEKSRNMWFFNFLLYNTLEYSVSIPDCDCYKEIFDVVRNYKVQSKEQ